MSKKYKQLKKLVIFYFRRIFSINIKNQYFLFSLDNDFCWNFFLLIIQDDYISKYVFAQYKFIFSEYHTRFLHSLHNNLWSHHDSIFLPQRRLLWKIEVWFHNNKFLKFFQGHQLHPGQIDQHNQEFLYPPTSITRNHHFTLYILLFPNNQITTLGKS